MTLQIKDKIGDHQAIKFSLQIEKEEAAEEKTNYNFRKANFDAMRADLDDEILERFIINSDAAQGFELLKNINLESCNRHIPKKYITINNGSTMMSISPSQDVREPMMQERGTTLMKPELNTSLLYPEWPHRQCVGLAFRSPARIAVCNTWSSGVTTLCRVGGTTSHWDLPCLTPLSVAGCG